MRKKLSPLQKQVLAKGQALRLAKGANGLLISLHHVLPRTADPKTAEMVLVINQTLEYLDELITLLDKCHYTSFKGDSNA